jgi:hypothetical protein
MAPKNKPTVEERAVWWAERVLASQKYVSAVDVLVLMGLIAPTHAENWRKGRIDYLEQFIQANPNKVARALATLHRWAKERGLTPSEARYVVEGRAGTRELRFTATGDPEAERAYRIQYISPDLPESKKKKIEDASRKAPERVVFSIVRDSSCTECGTELPKDSFLYMEDNHPLCLACAGLGDLEYLPSGDLLLTRRASKYTTRKAVVVRFSRSRGSYERRGILVEEQALAKAEKECTADAADRARLREIAERQRQMDDRKLVDKMSERIQQLFPGVPPQEARTIASHTAVRGSRRVGRTAAGRALDENALRMAVTAAIRHNYTNYDQLLASGLERAEARARVRDRVDETLEKWSG